MKKIINYLLILFFTTSLVFSQNAKMKQDNIVNISGNCANQPVSFNILNPSANIDSVLWTFDDAATAPNDTATSLSANYTYTSEGIYNIRLIIYQKPKNDTTFSKLNIRPGSAYLGEDTTICEGTELVLSPKGEDWLSYKWYNGSTQPTDTITEAGKYWITALNSCGYYTDTIEVSISPSPKPDLGNDTTSTCPDIPVTFDAEAGFQSYLWQDGSTGQTFTTDTAGMYIVTVTNEFGCTGSDSAYLWIVPNTVSLGDDRNMCDGDTLYLSPGGGYTTYEWQDGSTNSTFEVTTSGTYTVTAKSVCMSAPESATVNITFNPSPTVDIGRDTTVCNGGVYIFHAGAGYNTYLWENGLTDSLCPSDTSGLFKVTVTNEFNCPASDSAYLTILPNSIDLGEDKKICQGETLTLSAGSGFDSYLWLNTHTTQTLETDTTGTFFVEATNKCGTAKDTVNIIVNSLPTFDLGNDTSICQGDTAKFNAGVFASYLWHDNSTNQFFNTDTAGTFKVVITDINGCSNNDSIKLTINSLPNIDLGKDTSICQGTSIDFDAGAGFTSYLWQNASTEQILTANTVGEYWVKVTDANKCSANDTVVLEIKPLPSIFLGKDTTVCPNTELILNAGSGDSFIWIDGSTNSTLTVNTAGVYWGQATNNCGDARDSIEVFNFPEPTIEAGTERTVCKGNIIKLNAIGNGNITWNNNVIQNQDFTPEQTQYYTASIIDNNGCNASDSVLVTVNDLPSVNLGQDSTICEGENIQLDAGSGFVSYGWSNGNQTQTITVNETGQYVVQVSDGNCPNKDTININISPKPEINLTDQNLCENGKLTLDAGSSFTSYKWSEGSTTQSIEVTLEGDYSVTVTNSASCSNTANITVRQVPNPKISAVDTTISGRAVISASSVTDNLTYTLTNTGTGTVKEQDNGNFTNLSAGNYMVTVSDENNCNVTTVINISNFDDIITAPNIITPNGDGYNDTWFISGIQMFPKALIQIFDRHGKLLSEYKASQERWNGVVNGKPLPSGTYWYIVQLNDDAGNTKTGSITIKR